MVKMAFSLELKQNLSAKEAHAKSLQTKLNNPKAFRCADKDCGIRLTCTNWKLKNKKRLFFTPSSKENLHIAGCKESGEDEERQRSSLEIKNAKQTISKNGLINLKRISETKTVKRDNSNEKTVLREDRIKLQHVTNSNSSMNKRSEGSHITSILSFIEMYQDTSFDNNQKTLKISRVEYLSLNEFFVNIDEVDNIPKKQLRIYYGEAKLETHNNSMLKISFCNLASLPPVFTNKTQIFNVYYGKHAKKYIDTNIKVIVYFRGNLDDNKNKWCSFNDKFYQDLYFAEKN